MVREFDERNLAKSRAVCAAMAEEADTGKRRLTERERRILDMWPRYEDGEPVMIGDGVDGLGGEIIEVYIAENAAAIWNNFANHMHLSPGERVKRPAPEVLDADGVPIKVDDTVWHEDGSELHVIGFGGAQDGETMLVVEYVAGPTKWGEVRCLSVTHTRPAPKVLDADGVEIHVGDTVYDVRGERFTVTDIEGGLLGLSQDGFIIGSWMPADQFSISLRDSWERLEEDAAKYPCLYAEDVKGSKFDSCSDCPWHSECGGSREREVMARYIVRRAKALAGVEVAE